MIDDVQEVYTNLTGFVDTSASEIIEMFTETYIQLYTTEASSSTDLETFVGGISDGNSTQDQECLLPEKETLNRLCHEEGKYIAKLHCLSNKFI